ncbi:hypothetical protein TNCV_289291 [Trichonephila clavipes]|nr:hypothetical protein TNCV_289291 [Trichonephila clavipes]
MILNRLCLHLNTNDILILQQHCFRAELSTSHKLMREAEYIKTGFKDRKSTGAVFLDIQKAIDRLDSVAIEVSSRSKLTGIVRGKSIFTCFAQTFDKVTQTHANIPDNARCDGYDGEQHRLDYFTNDICTLRNGC